MTRISYEINMLYIMPEIERRPSFYYLESRFTPSPCERKLDWLLGEYQKREKLEDKLQ